MSRYHEDRSAIGRSALKLLDEGRPSDLQDYLAHGINVTRAMDFGTCVGLLLSNPEEFAEQTVKRPILAGPNADEEFKGTGAKARAAAWKEANADKLQLSEDEWELAHRLAQNIKANKWVKKFIDRPDAMPEASIVWRDSKTGLLVKSRPDVLIPSIETTVDYKITSGGLSDHEISNYIASYHVAMQGSMCGAGLIANGKGFRGHVVVFASRKTEKVRVVPMRLDEREQETSWLEIGDAQFEACLAEYAQCLKTGVFEDWGDHGRLVPVPAYVASRLSEWKGRIDKATPSKESAA